MKSLSRYSFVRWSGRTLAEEPPLHQTRVARHDDVDHEKDHHSRDHQRREREVCGNADPAEGGDDNKGHAERQRVDCGPSDQVLLPTHRYLGSGARGREPEVQPTADVKVVSADKERLNFLNETLTLAGCHPVLEMFRCVEADDYGIGLRDSRNRAHDMPVQVTWRRLAKRRNLLQPALVLGLFVTADAVGYDNGGAIAMAGG